ncbi:MAG: ABC transporter substrate-binding protein [Anaerolineae bacterium]
MNKQRTFTLLAALVVLAMLTAACVPVAAPTEVPAAAEPAEAPAPEGGVVKWFEFYTLDTGPSGILNQEWMAGIIEQFESENPGWKVELESAPWDQIDQRSIIDYNAGVPHDLMFSSPQLMAKHQEVGDYLDLTPFINQWPQSEIDDLNWSAGWTSATFGDEQVAVALGVHIRANVYNREMFEAAGLDPDKPFTTPEEVVEAAKLLTKADEDIWGLGLHMGSDRATIELVYAPLVWHFGGDFYDPDTKKATLAGDAGVKAVEWLWDAVHTHKITPPYAYAADADYGNLVNRMFLNGQVAQAMGFGSYWIANLEDEGMIKDCFPASANCTVGTASIMVQPSSVKAQFANSWNLSIHKLSENPEMAWKLIEVVLRPENLATYPDAGLPARLSMWDAPEYSSDFWQLWLEAAKNGRPMPATPFYGELADAVSAALQEALAGDRADIPAILQKFEDEWNNQYAP